MEEYSFVQRLYNDLRKDIYRARLSNSQIFDKFLLASSFILMMVLVWIQEFKGDMPQFDLPIIFLWLTQVFVLVSQITSNEGMTYQNDLNYRYYVLEEEEAMNIKNPMAIATRILMLFSLVTFVIAITILIF